MGSLFHWFDPNLPPSAMPLHPSADVFTGSAQYEAYLRQHDFSRLAGALGLMPPGLNELLNLHSSDETLRTLKSELQDHFVCGARRVYDAYTKGLEVWLQEAAAPVLITMMTTSRKRKRQADVSRMAKRTRTDTPTCVATLPNN